MKDKMYILVFTAISAVTIIAVTFIKDSDDTEHAHIDDVFLNKKEKDAWQELVDNFFGN